MAKARFRRADSATLSQSIAKRWTPRLVKDGFTPVSDYFLENYHRLDPSITSLEAIFIIHLMRHKWDERPPHPSFVTIAKRMGLNDASVRLHARNLEGKRLLNRITKDGRPIKDAPRTGEPNRFDLTPLFDALERLHMADEAAQQNGDQGDGRPGS
jgi:hypothetical protein